MHRTNLYLTHEQEQKLDQRARAAGVSRSAYVRAVIDRDLSEPASVDPAVEAAFGLLSDSYDSLAAGLFDDDPDLGIEA